MNKSKLAIIGTVGVPARYGGFETLAEKLVENLADQFTITVYNSAKAYAPHERVKEWKGARIVYVPLSANGAQGIIYDILCILHALFYADALLVLGVTGSFFFPFIRFFTKKRVIVNIDGLEWSRQKWGRLAKAFLHWSEGMAVRWADEVIADNAAIQKYAVEKYGKPTRLIPYGGNQAQRVALTPEVQAKYAFTNVKYAFSVCRIVPENNIHLLLEAFSKQSIFELAIIGNWESSAYGRKIRSKYIHQQHFHLLDPEYDITLLNQLRSNATIYLHGHSAGGTNPSLVEAMWLRVPIIAYDVIYNRVTTNNQAFYFANSVELVQLLKFADSQQLVDSAAYLEDFAHSHYCWTRVAAHYAALVEGNSVATIPVFEFDIPVNLRKQLDHF